MSSMSTATEDFFECITVDMEKQVVCVELQDQALGHLQIVQ